MQKLDKAKPRLRAGSWKVSLEETPNQSLYYLSSSPTFLVSGMPLVSAASVSHRGTCNALGIQPTFATAQRTTAQDGGSVCVYAPPQPATCHSQRPYQSSQQTGLESLETHSLTIRAHFFLAASPLPPDLPRMLSRTKAASTPGHSFTHPVHQHYRRRVQRTRAVFLRKPRL